MPETQKPTLPRPPPPQLCRGSVRASGLATQPLGTWVLGRVCSKFRPKLGFTQERRAQWRHMHVFSLQDGHPDLKPAFNPCPSCAQAASAPCFHQALTKQRDFGPILRPYVGPGILICKMGIMEPPHQVEDSGGRCSARHRA